MREKGLNPKSHCLTVSQSVALHKKVLPTSKGDVPLNTFLNWTSLHVSHFYGGHFEMPSLYKEYLYLYTEFTPGSVSWNAPHKGKRVCKPVNWILKHPPPLEFISVVNFAKCPLPIPELTSEGVFHKRIPLKLRLFKLFTKFWNAPFPDGHFLRGTPWNATPNKWGHIIREGGTTVTCCPVTFHFNTSFSPDFALGSPKPREFSALTLKRYWLHGDSPLMVVLWFIMSSPRISKKE